MALLVFYLVLAIGVSFLCSLCEAVLLTLDVSDAEVMIERGSRKSGARLREMKQQIDRPLAAILTLNTISHTVGAAGVGAQSAVIFGDAWVGVTSAVLTLLILVASEIIPKTLGATHPRLLAGVSITLITWMIWLTWPIVLSLNAMSRVMRGGAAHGSMSREQIRAIAEMARAGGVLDASEHAIIASVLRLSVTRVEAVMTPRTVIEHLHVDESAAAAIERPAAARFSRLPVFGDGPDDVRGVVLKHDLFRAVVDARGEEPVGGMLRTLHPVPETATLADVMDRFRETGHHMFYVVDEYGGTAGIVTMEDVFESILGREITDETDLVADMQALARRRAKKQRLR